MRWVVVYTDGSRFSSDDGPPEAAPGGGVAAVMQEDPLVGWDVHHGTDYYVYDDALGGWKGMHESGYFQYLMEPGLKIVKLGKYMRTDAYRALIAELQDKSARYAWEVPL